MAASAKKTAIIGFGSMGGMLARRFLESEALEPASLAIATRSPDRVRPFLEKWPGVVLAPSPEEVVRGASTVFLCVKPLDARAVLASIGPALGEGAHLVSIVGSLSLSDLEAATPAAVSIAMPAVCAEVGAGATIVAHGSRVDGVRAAALEALLSAIGSAKAVPEAELYRWTELSSCGPGLLSAILGVYLDAVLERTGLPRAEAELVWKETAYGTAKLLLERGLSFDEALARVATPGGITEAGASVLREGLPTLLDTMLNRMERRRAERDAALSRKG